MKTPSEIAIEKYLSTKNSEDKKRLDDKEERIKKNFPNARIEGENLRYDSLVLVPHHDEYFHNQFHLYEVEGYSYEVEKEKDVGKFLVNKPYIDRKRVYDKKIWGRIKFLFFSFLFIVISVFGYCLIFAEK